MVCTAVSLAIRAMPGFTRNLFPAFDNTLDFFAATLIKRATRTNTARKMRTFLQAWATTAFCQPDFSHNRCSYLDIGSPRLYTVITADLAPP